MHTLGITVYLFVMAVLFAIFEIESEGKYGWAEKLPTWYRVSGPVAAVYRRVVNKPLTGYHAALFFVPFLIFFWPMVVSSTVTWSGTLGALATYFAWVVVWDFAWFVLNPHYGARDFSRNKVWWFSNEPWIGGVMPFGYLSAWAISLVMAAISGWIGDGVYDSVAEQTQQLAWYLLFTVVLILVGAPIFRRYYQHMRRKDERDQAGIFH